VHGVHETDGLPYLVMEYIAGESLQDRIDHHGPLELLETVRIGLQTALGLAAAHKQGLIHRDIKPANLLLENGLARVKITDFGLARTAEDAALTQQGDVIGTPEYMAPEQARAAAVDCRADLFSLGSVLYAMCAGQPPFRGSTPLAVLRAVCEAEPTPIRALNPDVPAWLESFVGRLMAKNPDDRFQSGAEVAVLLEGYLAHLRQPGTPAPPLQSAPQAVRRSAQPGAAGRTARLGCVIGVLVCLLLSLLIFAQQAVQPGGPVQDPPQKAAQAPPEKRARFHQDLRSAEFRNPNLRQVGENVRYEAAGLRVTLPPKQGDLPPSGLAMNFTVHGDFEITVAYEILTADQPTTGYGVGVSVYAAIDPDTNDAVSLAQRRMPDGKTSFMSDRLTPGKGRVNHQVKTRTATAATGKLRLRRDGPLVRFLVADGDSRDFVAVDELEFGTGDVRWVQVSGNAGRSESALDLRLLALTVEADDLPGLVETPLIAAPAAVPETRPEIGGYFWLATGAAVGLGIMGFFARYAWLRRWSSSNQPTLAAVGPVPAIAISCPGCGKNLKVKAELVGRNVKCPGCGKTILARNVANRTSSAPRENSRRFTRSSRWLLFGVLAFFVLLLVGVFFLWLNGFWQSSAQNDLVGPPAPDGPVADRQQPLKQNGPDPLAEEKKGVLLEDGIPRKNYAQQYFQSFKGNDTPNGWSVFAHQWEERSRVEPGGLRITLLPGVDEPRSAGITSGFGLKGDFEITLNFEILKDPEAADVGKAGTHLSLTAILDTPLLGTPEEETAVLNRTMRTKGFYTWLRNRHAPVPLQKSFPTPTTTGRLGLVRSGEELYYLASRGVDQPLKFLQKYRFGAEDVQRIMISAATGGVKAQLDLRVTDLRIRADAIPGVPAPEAALGNAGAAPPDGGGRGWLLLGVLLAGTVGAILMLGFWLSKSGPLRRRSERNA
jgi:hypothetical protein